MKAIRKSANDNTAVATTDRTIASPGTNRKIIVKTIHLSAAGAVNVTIWDGASAGGNMIFGPILINAATAGLSFRDLNIEAYTSLVWQISGAVNTTIHVTYEEL